MVVSAADSASRWKKLEPPERRALRRLTCFSGAFPIDAVLALSPLLERERALERLLSSGVLVAETGGFRIEPIVEQLARAMPLEPKEHADDIVAFGTWLLEHIAAVEGSASDNAAAFDRLEPVVPDVRAAVGRLAALEEQPALAAELWCAISDLLFYRRLLDFDCPEYDLAIRCADKANGAALRARTRIIAGRAIIEVKSPQHARVFFEEALDITAASGLADWRADAIRGLGWVILAEGDLTSAKDHFSEAYRLHHASEHPRGEADACMALGVLEMLLGNFAASKRLLFQAEAILRACHDTVRLAKLCTLRQTLGLEERTQVSTASSADEKDTLEGLLARGQFWRAALLLARSPDADAKERARVLADLAGVSWKELLASTKAPSLVPSAVREADATRFVWELRADGRRHVLVAPDGTTHDLTRRGPFVKLLTALSSAKGALSAASLFEAAWPEDRVRHESALLRVYTTVRRLRKLGLPIATSGDGYFCDRIRTLP